MTCHSRIVTRRWDRTTWRLNGLPGAGISIVHSCIYPYHWLFGMRTWMASMPDGSKDRTMSKAKQTGERDIGGRPRRKDQMRRVSLYLPQTLVDRLKCVSDSSGLPITRLVEAAVRRMLDGAREHSKQDKENA